MGKFVKYIFILIDKLIFMIKIKIIKQNVYYNKFVIRISP